MKKEQWENNYEEVDDQALAKIAADIAEGNTSGITETQDGKRVSWEINVNVF